MIEYAFFAEVLSTVLVGLYLVLALIAFARTRTDADHHEFVRVHARYLEGPVVVMLLLVTVLLWISAVNIGEAHYAELVRYIGAAIRGALLALGGWLLGYYWVTRRSWLPRLPLRRRLPWHR